MMSEREQLTIAIAAQESLRAMVGDDVVDTTIAVLRKRLHALGGDDRSRQQRRKQVTVLFADVSGFTALSEKLDAEDLTGIMNALWNLLDAAILSNGGMIDKHIGDAVMALFGVEDASEYDPQNAIQAALDMQERLANFREERGFDLKMRIGINTGPVLLGEVGSTGEFTAMGDTVNLASRLEHACPVNSVMISHMTYQHVRGLFDVEILDPLEVKGKAELVQAYLVHTAKPQAFRVVTRGVQGVETKMIGRYPLLDQLQTTYEQAMTASRLHVTLLLGDAGIGKSRLIYEFINWLELQPSAVLFFRGRVTPQSGILPYSLIRSMLATHFDIRESDPPGVVKSKLEEGIGGALRTLNIKNVTEKAHFIGHLVGFQFPINDKMKTMLTDTEQFRKTALFYFARFMRAEVKRHGRTVMLLDDIHWADKRSMEVIDYVIQEVPDIPLLVIGVARPSLRESHPEWAEHETIEIDPLTDQQATDLIHEVLQHALIVPHRLRDIIVKRAAGNPYFIEELIKMLIEDQVIEIRETEWMIHEDRIQDVRVPASLTGVLQARLDSLPENEQAVLQQASILGRIFWDQAVVFLQEESDTSIDDITPPLAQLKQRELVFEQAQSSFADMAEYIFKNNILYDVTYESVLLRLRRKFHKQAALWLIDHSGERLNENAALIASHYELADDPDSAVGYLLKAGDWAFQIGANPDASDFYQHALDLLDDANDTARMSVLHKLGKAQLLMGDFDHAIDHLNQSLSLGETQSDQHIQVEALKALGRAYQLRGDFDEAQARLEHGITLAQSIDHRSAEAHLLSTLGLTHQGRGDYEKAAEAFRQALDIFNKIDDQVGKARAQVNLFIYPYISGNYDEARRWAQKGLQTARDVGAQYIEASALLNLGSIAGSAGDFEQANNHVQQSMEIYREAGNKERLALTLNNLGVIAELSKDFEKAKDFYAEALQVYKRIGARSGAALAHVNLGMVVTQLGDMDVAEGHLQDAIREAMSIGAMPEFLAALPPLATIYFKRKQHTDAALLLGFAHEHPACDSQTEEDVEEMITQLRDVLPQVELDALLSKGNAMTIDTIGAKVLGVKQTKT